MVVGGLPGSGVDEAVARLSAEGITAAGLEGNVGDLSSVEALRDRALEWGQLDIWINNAGAAGIYGPTHKGAKKPVPFQNAYASSKAWNRSFTRTVRTELKGTGVRVHGYDPGLVKTEMLGRVTASPGMEKRVRALPYVVGLWGQTPEQAATPVLRLLVDDRRIEMQVRTLDPRD